MLLLERPGRLMLGYWLGAMLTSITLGLVIVFTLEGSGAVSTTKRTISPLADIVLGALALVLALALATGRDRRLADARARRKEGKGPPKWQQTLSRGTPRATFVLGVLLTLPGASYIAGLTRLSKLDYGTAETVLAVLGFNLVMLILLELPMIAFAVDPEKATRGIERAKAWARARARDYAVRGLAVIGGLLILKGILGIL
jgi:hypothetical protein